MKKIYINKILLISGVTAFLLSNSLSVQALPGQTVTAFKHWVTVNPVLKGIVSTAKICQQSEEANYSKQFKLTASKVYFRVWISCQDKKISMEEIGVEENFSDKKMVLLVEKIMGKAVLNEMMSSKILLNTSNNMVLKGAKYGFVVEKSPPTDKYFSVKIMKPDTVTQVLNDLKSGNNMD